MIKKGIQLAGILNSVLLFSSCSSLTYTLSSPGKPLTNQNEIQKLQQQVGQLKNENQLLQFQIDSLQSVWPADLTGDGKNETITAPPWPIPTSLYEHGGNLNIESAGGRPGVAGIYNVGANTPLLLTLQWGGGRIHGELLGRLLI